MFKPVKLIAGRRREGTLSSPGSWDNVRLSRSYIRASAGTSTCTLVNFYFLTYLFIRNYVYSPLVELDMVISIIIFALFQPFLCSSILLCYCCSFSSSMYFCSAVFSALVFLCVLLLGEWMRVRQLRGLLQVHKAQLQGERLFLVSVVT